MSATTDDRRNLSCVTLMDVLANIAKLPAQLAAAWPPEKWRDVHVLAAVSGGADSMALLRALAEVKSTVGGAGRLLAGHVNHGLRGEQADADEAWLRAEANRLNIPLEVRRHDTTKLAEQQGDGLEAAARAARYQLLADMAAGAGARFIAVAHTRDDQAETVVFRLLRGTGLAGLAGMPFTRPLSPVTALVRPLLASSRQDVQRYLQAIGQDYRSDATNERCDFARNRIRNELLPYLREHFNLEVADALVRTAGMAREAQELVDSLARRLLDRCRAEAPPGAQFCLLLAPLVDQAPILVRETLRAAWREAGLGEQSLASRHWRQLAELALSAADASLNLPGNLQAHRQGDRLVFRAKRQTPGE
jgi:tRNA(Ile)-lysidine synthase